MSTTRAPAQPIHASEVADTDQRPRSGGVDPERDLEEARWLVAYKNGDSRGFEQLYLRYRKPVFNFCYRMLLDRQAAEDAFQEVFLRVVRAAPTWEKSAKVRTWVYTIAHHHCIDLIRKARLRRTTSLDQPLKLSAGEGGEDQPTMGDRVADEDGAKPDRAAESHRMQAKLAEAISGLSDEQREVFVMREYAGMPFKEIAEIAGVSENTVKSRMRYALEHLRQHLWSRHGIDENVLPGDEP